MRSGVVNAGGAFDLRVTTTADESTYAGIVRLVREAEHSTPPFVRLADRYALWFLFLTLVVAGLAWALSGELARAVAVLVVATPCPLILAAPVAFVSGLSRSAQRGVIVKGGGTLERLARCHTLLFDKTGTLTAGQPDGVGGRRRRRHARPTRCCAWPPRSIRSPRMCWPRRWSGPRASADLALVAARRRSRRSRATVCSDGSTAMTSGWARPSGSA